MFQTKEIELLKKEVEETQKEATDRIGQELRDLKKLEERKSAVKNWFRGLTNKEMSEAEFLLYNERFENSKEGYNIKSFIRDIGLRCNDETFNN